MRILIKNITFLILCFVTASIAGQDVSIQLGPANIGQNQYFTIKAIVKNKKPQNVSNFPNIPGFEKAGVSSGSSMQIINGRMNQQFSVTQNYTPKKQGRFNLKPFKVTIDGKTASSKGQMITVGAPVQRQSSSWDPFGDLFGKRRNNNQPREFVDVQDDAFFAITPNKTEIYEGEGVTVTMAFYIALSNRAQIRDNNMIEQIRDIEAKVRPENAWEEKTVINEFNPVRTEINGKPYNRLVLSQSTFFPFNDEDIDLPSMPLKMIKLKEAKQKSWFGNNYQTDYKTYYSRGRVVKVKPLPEHPLKDLVAVGNFKLKENIEKGQLETGNSFNYKFSVIGEGNINAIKAPVVPEEDERLQIYPPNEHQNINAGNGLVTGSKLFDYYIIPNEPGEVDLGEYFNWVYFNTRTEKYDTLRSSQTVNIIGESQKNSAIMASDLGTFYNRIPKLSDDPVEMNPSNNYLVWIKLILGLVTAGTIGLLFIKRKGSE